MNNRFENVLAVNLKLENVFKLAYQSTDLKNWRQPLRMRKRFFVIMQRLYASNFVIPEIPHKIFGYRHIVKTAVSMP